jgi:hypothetical protein
MIRKKLIFMLASVLMMITAGSAMADNPKGRDQLIDAFDAAWVRVVRSGEYRNIINNFAEPIPGVIDATEYIVNQPDCLPNPDVTPFPEKPKGRFKKILKNEEIIRGEVGGAPWFVSQGANTSDWFSGGFGGSDILADILDAVLAEISAHYGIGPINVVTEEIPFPFNTTAALQDGIFGFSVNVFSSQYPPFTQVDRPGVVVDFLDQFNAKGGESEALRRLKGRRATCTLSSSGQFIHVPVGSPFVINNIDDLRADPSIRICTGNLSTQSANQYFPDNPVETKRSFDIRECYEALAAGEADVFINSLPVNPTAAQVGAAAGPALQPGVDTKIVAGTPYWVREDKVNCETVASPPGPFPPTGVFYECTEDPSAP